MPQSMNRRVVLENKLMPTGKGSARGALWKLDYETRRRAMKINELCEARYRHYSKIIDRWKEYSSYRAARSILRVQNSANLMEERIRNVKPWSSLLNEQLYRKQKIKTSVSKIPVQSSNNSVNSNAAFKLPPIQENPKDFVKEKKNKNDEVPARVIVESGNIQRWHIPEKRGDNWRRLPLISIPLKTSHFAVRADRNMRKVLIA